MAGYPEIFGTPIGSSAALADMQRAAQTQGQQLKNQQMEIQLQEQQKMQALMQQAAQPTESGGMVQSTNPADRIQHLADLALNSGLTASGTKLATTAAEIRLKEAQTRHADAQSVQQQYNAAKLELDTVDKLVSGVHDQASWDAANNLFEQMTGNKSPFAGLPYNPALVQSIQQHTVSLKDKIELGIKEYDSQTRRAAEQSAASFRSFREGIMARQQAQAEADDGASIKAYGTGAPGLTPTKSELDGAVAAVSKLFPNLPTAEVNNASRTVALGARGLLKSTPGMTKEQAFSRAAQDAKDLGVLDKTYSVTGQPPSGNEILENQVALAREGQSRSQVVGGWGKQATARWARIEGMAINQIMNENPGMSRQDAARQFANEQLGLHARGQSINQLTKMQGATRQAVDQLEYNVAQTTKILQNIPSSDMSPVLNALARGEEKWTGDPRYNALFYYMNGVATESARIMSGGQASAAQLHTGAAEEARKWANENMTPKQFIEGVAPAIVAEGRQRVQTYQSAIDAQNSRSEPLSGGGDTGPVNKPPLPKGPAVGTVEQGYRFKGGDPADPSSWEAVK